MTKRSAARASQLIDNDQVRVTRFEFKPDYETGWNENGFDYVIVALRDCNTLIEEKETARKVDTEIGAVYCQKADVKHHVINGGTALMAFVEAEMRQ